MNMSDWPIRQLKVTSLQLDPENPRMATAVRRLTQQEVMADLLEHEEVMELVRDIARQGYFPNEVLIAVKEDSRTIVVEGNRRLAAVKLLKNFELAPTKYAKRVKGYAETWKGPVDKVPVLIAPSREAALPMIIARHKGKCIKSWTPVMQARFVATQIERGYSVEDVVSVAGMERADVLRGLRDAKLYDVIRSLPLAPAVDVVVADPRRFPFSTLQRTIDFSAIQNLLGMKTDAATGFTTSLPADRFQKLLGQIVTDIVKEKITSRTHNTSKEVDAYVKGIEASFGKSTKGRTATPADEMVDPSKVKPVAASKPRKTKRKVPAEPVGLIPKNFRVDVEDDRILAIIEELTRLRIISFRNATALLLRSLLDLAVQKYFSDTGELAEMKKASPKLFQGKRADWVPTLNQMLTHMLHTSSIPLPGDGRKALNKFLNDTKSSLTLDTLNWFTHIRFVPPTVDELRAFWTMLTPIMQLTLQRPQ
jgi:hypothetical protein